METILDNLISREERRIDQLMLMRSGIREAKGIVVNARPEDIEHDIEKAYEQLAIYKIRKMMEFQY